MKRWGPALVLLLLFPVFAFSQTQTGNASYNAEKTGFTIGHSSLSFNTRVKVTNLKNSRFDEAVVTARIPIRGDWIADISRDLGDSLEMPKNGMTLVEIEILAPRTAGEQEPAPAVPEPAPAPVPAPVAAPAPVSAPVAPTPRPIAPPPVPAPRPVEPVVTERIVERVVEVPVPGPEVRTEIQYVPVPSSPERPGCLPFLIPMLCLLILIIILIIVVILLVARRPVFWPWYRPVRIRRRYRCGRWGRNFY